MSSAEMAIFDILFTLTVSASLRRISLSYCRRSRATRCNTFRVVQKGRRSLW